MSIPWACKSPDAKNATVTTSKAKVRVIFIPPENAFRMSKAIVPAISQSHDNVANFGIQTRAQDQLRSPRIWLSEALRSVSESIVRAPFDECAEQWLISLQNLWVERPYLANGSGTDERCGKPGADPGRGRRGRLLHKSRHLGDAFCRCPRSGRGHALYTRPVRGRGHRSRRWLFPHERKTGLDLAASRTGPRQWSRQPAQREKSAFGHRQHRRPACDLPHRLQRAANLRHRRPGAADVGMGAHLAEREVSRRRRRGSDRGCKKRAAADRHADSPGRHRLERG